MSSNLVNIANRQNYVNEELVNDLEYVLKLAKEGKITLFSMMCYCPGEGPDRWLSCIDKGGICTVTDGFVFTESLSRQVESMRVFVDNLREEVEDE